MSEVKVNKITPRTDCGTTQLGDSGDTVTVAGDLKSNSLKATDGGVIISQSGTNITIGASGDTVSLASGASQSGFGRSGSVDWQTSIKTSNFTAASGEGYFCNTGGGAFTLTLPSSPSVGDIVALKDYGSSFATNNLTIGRGGSNLNGGAVDSVRNTDNESLTLVYADATKGWLAVEEGTGFVGEQFITATGGTITTCGDFKIHTFTGPGTFSVSKLSGTPSENSVEYVVVAGGGGGGANGGGGGAGGFRFASPTLAPATYPAKPLAAPAGITVTATSFPITVGAGGSNTVFNTGTSTSGANSSFSTITSAGGGHGGSIPSPFPGAGAGGGSGGGGGGASKAGGPGNSPPVSPAQGKDGGTSASPGGSYGGGGGALACGANAADPSPGGAGGVGAGLPTAFGSNGVPSGGFRFYAGGGGGGTNVHPSGPAGGPGGTGGGGAGGQQDNPGAGTAGTANTGGGGGGSAGGSAPTSGAGGSGIVIIRYKFQ